MNALTDQLSRVTVTGDGQEFLRELVNSRTRPTWVFHTVKGPHRAFYVSQFIAKELQNCTDETVFQVGITILLETYTLAEKWLKKLFPSNQPEELTQRIMAVIQRTAHGKKIAEQFARIPLASRTDAAQIAIFATLALEYKQLRTKEYYKKDQYGLPYSLHLDVKRQAYCILSKGTVQDSDKSGTSKRVTHAFEVPFSLKQPVVDMAQSVNKDAKPLLNKEYALQRELFAYDPEGICPIYSMWNYQKGKIKKSSAILALLAESFGDYFKRVSRKEQIAATKELLRAVAKMHERGYIHGDLDESNIRCKGSNVRIVDFGFTFQMIGEDQQELKGLFPDGFYGRIDRTAPEFLGQMRFKGDYTKVEMWVIGFILLSLLKERPNFECEALPKVKYPERARLINKSLQMMQAFGPTADEKDPFKLFAYTLLSYDHVKRPTAREALEILDSM